MKRILSLLLALFLLSTLPLAALADVIWEPEDDFYSSHAGNCQHLNRLYLLNGSKGYVEVYESPNSRQVIDVIPNQQSLQVSFGYPAAAPAWGVVNYIVNGQGQAENSYQREAVVGWIPMNDLVVQYDGQAFQAEHAQQLAPYAAQSLENIVPDSTILAWSYPGAEAFDELELHTDYAPYPEFSQVYTDPDGRIWGNCSYYMGSRDFWVCLDDPTNPDLPVTEIHYDNLVPPANPDEISTSAPIASPAILGGILVAGVVVVTLVLLRRYRKKDSA